MSRTVCCFIDSRGVGGAERALAGLVATLDRDRWRPLVLHHPAPGLAPLLHELAAAGVQAVAVDPLPEGVRGAARVPAFVRVLRDLRPSVFHAHLVDPQAGKFALAGAIAARIPAVVATVHAFPPMAVTRSASAQRTLIARGVDRYVVASRHAATRLGELLPAARTTTTVIPNGIDPADYARPVDPALRARLREGGRHVVLVPARLDELKGHAFLLQAARALPDVQVVLVGDGPDRARLQALAGALGIAARVTFLGYRDDVAELLAASDLVVLPTLNEAFGLVLLEGMAAGRPVITTRVGGPEDVVVDGETGVLVAPADARALQMAIRGLLDDPLRAGRLAAAGQARVQERFTLAAVSNRVAELYATLLDDRVARVTSSAAPTTPGGARARHPSSP